MALPLAAKGFEPVAGGDLTKLAFRRLAGQPSEKPCQRSAVAAVRRSRAVDLRRIFGCFRQEARVGGAMDFRSRRGQPVENPGSSGGRIRLHSAALHREFVERRSELLWGQDGNRVAKMALDTGDELAPVDKKAHRAVLTKDRKRQRQRRVRHIAAADVEQPGNRFRHRQDDRRDSVLLQGSPQPRSLRRRALAGE